MGKYEKRRVFRTYRRAGIPFILSVHLARSKGKMAHAAEVERGLPPGYTLSEVHSCECCGPTHLTITRTADSKAWSFDYWTLLPD